jgi:hypothetical protein
VDGFHNFPELYRYEKDQAGFILPPPTDFDGYDQQWDHSSELDGYDFILPPTSTYNNEQ